MKKCLLLFLFLFSICNVSASTYTEYGDTKESLVPLEETELRQVEVVRKYKFYKLVPTYIDDYYIDLEGYIKDETKFQDVYLYREREKIESKPDLTVVELNDFPMEELLVKDKNIDKENENTNKIPSLSHDVDIDETVPYLDNKKKNIVEVQKFDKIRQKEEVKLTHNTKTIVVLGGGIIVICTIAGYFLVKK